MENIQFYHWTINSDKSETEKFYKEKFKYGESDFCTCLDCQNFKSQKDKILSTELLTFFTTLGIDFKCEDRLSAIQMRESQTVWYMFSFFFKGSLNFDLNDKNNKIELGKPFPMTLTLKNETKNIYEITVSTHLPWTIETPPIPELNYNMYLIENGDFLLVIKPNQRLNPFRVSISPEKQEIYNGNFSSEQDFELIIKKEDMAEIDTIIIDTNYNTKDHKTNYSKLKK
jgi:hypothetical protein